MDTDDSYSVVDSEEAAPQKRRRRSNVPLPSTCPYRYTGSVTEKHNSCIYSAKFCPFLEDLYVFGTVAGRQVSVYECVSKKTIPRATYEDENATEEYYSLSWSIVKVKDEDKPALVFGGKHGIIRAIDPFTGKTHSTMLGHGDAVNEISYHPVWPSIIASASKDLTVRLWHVPSQTPIAIFGGFQGHQDQILSLDFDYTGKYIVSGSMDHTLRLWNVGNDQIMARMKSIVARPDNAPVQPIEMHFPCGASKDLHRNYVDCVKTVKSYIFSKACENCIILSKFGEFNDPSAGGSGVNGFETFSQQVAELELPNSQLWFIRFGITVGPPLSSWIACGNDVGIVHIWDLHSIPISKKSNYQISHRDFPTVIRRIEFSPDGNIMIVVGEGGKISRCDKTIETSKNGKKENGIIRDSSSAETD